MRGIDATERGSGSACADKVESAECQLSKEVPSLRAPRCERERLLQRGRGFDSLVAGEEKTRLKQAHAWIEPIDRVARTTERTDERCVLTRSGRIESDAEITKLHRREHLFNGGRLHKCRAHRRRLCNGERFRPSAEARQTCGTKCQQRKRVRGLGRTKHRPVVPDPSERLNANRRRHTIARSLRGAFLEDSVAQLPALKRHNRPSPCGREIKVVVETVANPKVAPLFARQVLGRHRFEHRRRRCNRLRNAGILRKSGLRDPQCGCERDRHRAAEGNAFGSHKVRVARLRSIRAECAPVGYRPPAMTLVLAAVGLILALAVDSQHDSPPSSNPDPAPKPAVEAPPTPPSTPVSAARERIEAFLEDLERSGGTTRSLSGNVAIETNDLFKETSEFRAGRLVIEGTGSTRRVALHLDELIIDGHTSKSIDHYIFADGWYCRLDHKNRSFTKRSIAKQGEDPLQSIGGQIPIPIGLKKADVLARFEVSETQVPIDIPILGSMQNVAGLRLVPKPGTEVEKETEVLELFFDRVSLVPVGVVLRAKVANPAHARWTAARLNAAVVNGDVRDSDRALLKVPEAAPEGWATVDDTR